MKNLIILSIVLMVITSFSAFAEVGNNGHLKRIAEISLNLSHYPSASEKKELVKMMKNEDLSESIRVLAHALYNLEHSVAEVDKKGLNTIINNASESNKIRTLANVLLNINHQPSSTDKVKLKSIIDA